MGDVLHKEIDGPLKPNEIPEEKLIDKNQFILPPIFHDQIPKMYQRRENECMQSHRTRVENYLKICSDDKFQMIADKIDPDDVQH